MRILITGISGFAGGHLAEQLWAHEEKVELLGICRSGNHADYLKPILPSSNLFQVDLAEREKLVPLLRDVEPDQIYHLAGHADVGSSLRDPASAWRDNLAITQSLYDAIIEWGGTPRIVYAGSGLVYGDPKEADQFFEEDSPFYPVHPYGCSKAACDLLSYQVSRYPGLPIMRARPLNHIGPRQSPRFAVAHFAKQIAAIEHGLQEPVISTGDLSTSRDLTDVRDVVRAYIRIMNAGTPGEAYNIATEKSHRIRDVLESLLTYSPAQVQITQRSHLKRASESPQTKVSTKKIRRRLGWQPEYTPAQTLQDTLNYWRSECAKLINDTT